MSVASPVGSSLPAMGIASDAGLQPLPPVTGYVPGELLCATPLRRVYRALRLADQRPVVIKTISAEYPARAHVAALRREFQILQRLQKCPSVVRALELEPAANGNVALVMEPFGLSLTRWLERQGATGRPLPLSQWLTLAIGLARAVGEVHEADVVHKNIEPNSILIDDALQLRLIDFSIASELSLERQNYAGAQPIEGALAYLSPEQTGRMNRDLDYRSDFYSLGVTLYQLLTGQLPFTADSVLGWVHSHISRSPRSPTELDAGVPPTVAAVVLKLLAKNPEDRYQGSAALLSDLERCQRELTQTGVVSMFAPGHRDVSRRFQVPQRLYGREAELSALLSYFERAAGGRTEICMVAGYSGVGKSALVNELSKPLARRGGYLVQGKFDQFQRSTPYAAVAAALRSLVPQLLTEPQGQRDRLRDRLLAALGPNGQVLVTLVPDLELVIGAQPAVPELPRNEAQNRFQITLLDFIRVVAQTQPLVIFLDDLQFSDAATLQLIRWLATARDLSHLLLIGAYRSNEVDIGHPLRLALNDIEEVRPVHTLAMRPLGSGPVEQLVADTLHTDRAACAPLSGLLFDESRGNPFFLTEMLKTLAQNGSIRFEELAGRWRWDLETVRCSGLSNNVVDFVIANLNKLPPQTRRVLQLAACIGSNFDLRTLSVIHERTMEETARELLPALQRHMVIPLHNGYKLVGQSSDGEASDVNPDYRFQHDRIQQAAYALIDADRRQAVHLSVGRLIQRHADEAGRRERLIDIVGHLNEGRQLIEDPAERLLLAQLNLTAGTQAQHSSAYGAALAYLGIAQELLPHDAWDSQYTLMLAVATEYQQCAYLTARYDEAETWIERILAHARTPLERAEILSQRTRQYATIGKMEDSIRAAVMGLSLLGLDLNDTPDAAAIRRERAAVRRNLAGRRIADLIDAPPLTDPAAGVAIRLLMEIFPAAFLSGSGSLFPFLVLKSVNISLRMGTSPESAFAYAAYGMLLCGSLDDPALGLEFGQLAVAMNDRLDDIGLKSRVIYVYTMFVHHWSHHWSSMTPWFRRGIDSGYRSGDLLYLAYSAQDCIIWDPKLDLETAEREHAQYLVIVKDSKYQDSFDSGSLFLQMQRNFLGRTDALCSMNDESFDEARCVAGMRGRRFMTGIANFHIYKAEICALYRHFDEALVHVQAQDALIASAMSLPQLVRFHVMAFLTRAALLPGWAPDQQAQALQRLRADLARMRRWAKHCPANFRHLHQTMEGELARLQGRAEAALSAYERAIDSAREFGWLRDEAVANELAGRHLLAQGRRKAAEGYLRASWHLFERWGARRKVQLLEQEFAHLAGTASAEHANTAVDSAALDLGSVMKASQAISGEIVLEQLWTSTMRIMLESAGGQRGCFVVRRDGSLVIEGLCEASSEAGSEPGSTTVAEPLAMESAHGARMVPVAVIYQVLNTHRPVVLNDATRFGHFARDAYLHERPPQSLLCVPLMRGDQCEGAIYIENNLASHVFTADRIDLIKLLAAQMSISIENARLYAAQRELVSAQGRFVPHEFLEVLDRPDIARVDLGENVAKTMSVMFADLRNFTPLAERMDARSIISLLNRYFASMEKPIAEAGGFIDSFAGDEIKVLFDVGADAALRAAIAMRRALDELNERLAATGQPALAMGIGINTGPVVLGTVGGLHRLQCSVIGDTVNTASRIEQLTKLYKVQALVGEHTVAALVDPGAFLLRQVDRVAVKGKASALTLYELLDAESPARRAAKLANRDLLADALQAYAQRDFAAALIGFGRMAESDSLDAVPALFIARAQRYLVTPPPADWPGYETLTEK